MKGEWRVGSSTCFRNSVSESPGVAIYCILGFLWTWRHLVTGAGNCDNLNNKIYNGSHRLL